MSMKHSDDMMSRDESCGSSLPHGFMVHTYTHGTGTVWFLLSVHTYSGSFGGLAPFSGRKETFTEGLCGQETMKHTAVLLTPSYKMLNLLEQLGVIVQQAGRTAAQTPQPAPQMFSVYSERTAKQHFGMPLIQAALLILLLVLISFSQWHLLCAENRSCCLGGGGATHCTERDRKGEVRCSSQLIGAVTL